MEMCKRDIIFWFNNFLYTDKNDSLFTDQTLPPVIPMLPFEFQKEFILDLWDCIEMSQLPVSERTKPTNIFIEKSRQMGLSWLVVAVYTY